MVDCEHHLDPVCGELLILKKLVIRPTQPLQRPCGVVFRSHQQPELGGQGMSAAGWRMALRALGYSGGIQGSPAAMRRVRCSRDQRELPWSDEAILLSAARKKAG